MKNTLDFIAFLIVYVTMCALTVAGIAGLCVLYSAGHWVVVLSIVLPLLVWAFMRNARRA